MTIALPPQLEQRVRGAASQEGIPAEVYIRRLIERHVPPAGQAEANRAGLALLEQWDAEDATTDPEELERRRQQWEEFRRSMNENSLSDRPVYP